MLTRRFLLVSTFSGACLLAIGPSAWAQAAGDPTNFIVSLGNRMAAIVNGPGAIAQKRQQMVPMVEQAVDIDDIGRFCLGRFWRVATPEQQQRYLQLFRATLLNNITGRLGEFQGVSFRPTTTTQREGNYYVGTVINRPNQQPSNLQWVVSTASGQPRIIDLVAEGTSLRLTKRADYASYLSQHSNDVNALLAAMQQQVGAG